MAPTIASVTAQGRSIEEPLSSLLSPEARDAVPAEANRWIKRLRLVRYGEQSMRDRFTYRGDSLWWFTELYLHKMRRLERAAATILALEAARERYSPSRLEIRDADALVRNAAEAFSRAHGVPIDVHGDQARDRGHSWSSYLIGLTARLSATREDCCGYRARN